MHSDDSQWKFYYFFSENIFKEKQCSKALWLRQDAGKLDVCLAVTFALSGRGVLAMLCMIWGTVIVALLSAAPWFFLFTMASNLGRRWSLFPFCIIQDISSKACPFVPWTQEILHHFVGFQVLNLLLTPTCLSHLTVHDVLMICKMDL